MPAELAGLSYDHQLFVFDAGAPHGLACSNGLEVWYDRAAALLTRAASVLGRPRRALFRSESPRVGIARRMRIVLTGGPHAGKTTLIDALERRGERVVPEAAIAVIADLRRELGDDAATAWRRAHAAQFQERIAVKQLALEDALRLAPGERAFFDRGLFDGLAYCRLADVPAPRAVEAERARGRYDLVVLCELVLPFTDRAGTGRTSDLVRAQAIETALAAVWTELGYPLLRLPSSLTVAEREALLLERITALGPARAP